ncbi:PAS domain S-box protein [Sunxiuqinia sp. A32]|uniref:PAS domain S-box protein n=1 Tax=Sunxiuqinia sp. A32 TaxID=3461496 RepID=UPI004046481C
MNNPSEFNHLTKRELIETIVKVHKEKDLLKNFLAEVEKKCQVIYKLSELFGNKKLSSKDILEEAIKIIPAGWQYPEITCVRITLGNNEFKTNNFTNTKWKQSEIISIENQPNALIEVCYLTEKPQEYEGPFSKEERNLLKEISEKINTFISKKLIKEEFTAIFKESPIAKCIIDIDHDNHFEDVNEVFQKFTGYSQDELIGKRPLHIGLFKNPQVVDTMLNALTSTGFIKNLEFEYIKKNGEVTSAVMNSQLVQTQGRNLALASFIDLTEILQLKKSEKEANELNRALIDAIPFGMEIINESGKILFANNIMKDHFGDDIVGKLCWESYRKDQKPCPFCPLEHDIVVGETIVNTADGIVDNRTYEISHTGFLFEGKKAYLKLFNDITEKRIAEKELVETKEKLQGILDNLDDAYFQIDMEGNITYINSSAVNMFGYSSVQEMIGMPVINLYESRKERKRILKKLHHSGKIHDWVSKGLRKDSSTFWVSVNAKFLYDNSGQIKGTQGLIRNVTRRIEADKKVDESEKIFHDLFNNLNSGVAVYDVVDDGKDFIFKYFNDAGERIDKQNRNELIGKSIFEVRPGIDEFGLIKIFRKVVASKKPAHHPVKIYSDERLDGYYENYVFLLPTGELVAVFDDITESVKIQNEIKLAKDKAEESDFRLKLATDSGKLGIWDWNIEKNNMVWNDRMFELYGMTPDTFTGEIDSWGNGLHPEDKEQAIEEVNLALNQTKKFNTTFRVVHPSGKILHIKADAVTLLDEENKPIRMIGINRNVTKAVLREIELIDAKNKAQESDRLKSAFLMNMSHEIRTPMNGILGFMELLKDPDLKEEERISYVDIVNKSGERLLNTINDIIEISRIEIGDINLTHQEVDVSEMIKHHFNFFKLHADRKGVDLKITRQIPVNSALIKSDKQKLDSIIMNLIKNAVKFTPKGSIEIGNYIENKQLHFFFKDTGDGIPEDKLKIIFDPFVQADLALNRKYQGSGIGLSIVKSYVDALNGKIIVESEVGKGSTFTVSIPYHKD